MNFKEIEFQLHEILLRLRDIVAVEPELSMQMPMIDACIDRLRTLKYNVAVVGEFRRGKSSLINAILGMPILPSDVTPTTATINRITYDVQPGVTIYYKDGTKKRLDDIKDLSKYVTKLSEEQSRIAASVQEAVIQYPVIICQNHVDIIDTPGLDDEKAMTDITVSMLKNVDAVVVAISALSPFSETECDFVVKLIESKQITHIVFALTFIDQIGEDEFDDVFRAICSRIRENTLALAEMRFADCPELQEKAHRLINRPCIFPVSAKNALKAFATNDSALLKASRISYFKEKLLAVVTAEQSINVARKSVGLLNDILTEIKKNEKNKLATFLNEKKLIEEETRLEIAFLRDFALICDKILFTEISSIPSFPWKDIHSELQRQYIAALSCITRKDSAETLRTVIQKTTSVAIQMVNDRLQCYLGEYCQKIVSAVRKALHDLSPLPAIDFDPEKTISIFLETRDCEGFNIHSNTMLPSGDLLECDVMDCIRSELVRAEKQMEIYLDTYFTSLRCAYFKTFRDYASHMKSPSLEEISTQHEKKVQACGEWTKKLYFRIIPLYEESKKILHQYQPLSCHAIK